MKHEQFQLLLQEGKNYLCHASLAVLVDMPQEVFSHKLVAVFIRSQMSHRDRWSRFYLFLLYHRRWKRCLEPSPPNRYRSVSSLLIVNDDGSMCEGTKN